MNTGLLLHDTFMAKCPPGVSPLSGYLPSSLLCSSGESDTLDTGCYDEYQNLCYGKFSCSLSTAALLHECYHNTRYNNGDACHVAWLGVGGIIVLIVASALRNPKL